MGAVLVPDQPLDLLGLMDESRAGAAARAKLVADDAVHPARGQQVTGGGLQLGQLLGVNVNFGAAEGGGVGKQRRPGILDLEGRLLNGVPLHRPQGPHRIGEFGDHARKALAL